MKASPDGYTLLVSSSAVTAAVILHKSLSYNVLRDLEPVAMFGGEPSILIGAPNKGYANLADLVTAAESNVLKVERVSVYVTGNRVNSIARAIRAGSR